MRVALLSDTFAKNMGYLENMLSKYLVRLGVEVHVVTMDLPAYYWSPENMHAYSKFSEVACAGTIARIDGYTLHVLGHKKVAGYMKMIGLREKLSTIRPDIVQVLAPVGWAPLETFIYRSALGYKIFSGCHMTASAFPLLRLTGRRWVAERFRCLLFRYLPGRLISLATEKCYAVTEDCAEIAWRYLGVPRHKIKTMYLGVDTECFRPVDSTAAEEERSALRKALGFADTDIVCIYTGKLIEEKRVRLLAEAVERLRSNEFRYRALFVGGGPETATLKGFSSAVVLGFMQVSLLAKYYRAADIAVWPGTESTSMLDAAACGLPIVISDKVVYRAPVDGNGRVFRQDSLEDLVTVLGALRNQNTRMSLGRAGAARMASDFSWSSVACRRLIDYKLALDEDNFQGSEVGEQSIRGIV